MRLRRAPAAQLDDADDFCLRDGKLSFVRDRQAGDDYFGDVAERDQLDAAGNGCASGDQRTAVSSSVAAGPDFDGRGFSGETQKALEARGLQ